MNRNAIFTLAATTLFGLAACSTGPKRGSVVMKLNDVEAHVGIGKGEVSVGDHLQLYRNVCTGAGRSGADRSCRKEPTGHGEVTQVLSGDYSVVKFPSGTQFSEGDTLEKHAH